MCADDAEVRGLLPSLSRPFLTYGIEQEADLRAFDLRHAASRTEFRVRVRGEGGESRFLLNLPGRHNVLNALAAIGVARELGVDDEAIARALEGFQGIGRRFNILYDGPVDGKRVMLVDDYGHHPREIAATLQAARSGWPGRRILLVFQPHRYSRTQELFEDFVRELSQPDALLLTEVYAAGEEPISGVDGRALSRAVRARGQVTPVFVEPLAELPEVLRAQLRDGDIVLLMGAGDIGAAAAALPERLGEPGG